MSAPAESPVVAGKATWGSRLRQAWPIISIAAIVGLIWCLWFRKEPILIMGMACPHSWEGVDSFPPSGFLDIAPQTTDIPEFHDCQRFVSYDGDTPHYGHIYAIFARQDVDKVILPMSIATDITPIGGSDVPKVGDGKKPGTTTPSTTTTPGSAVFETFGVIFADADYADLGLKKRFNCLRLQRTGITTFTALMVPVGGHSEACVSSASLTTYQSNSANYQATSATVLTVAYQPLADVPPVARWDWDSHNRVQTIGILCPGGWCNVYKLDGATIADAPAANLGTTSFATNMVKVKGWYDEQALAHIGSGQLTVGSQFVSVYPDPGLIARQKFTDFKKGSWYPSAYVVMHAPDDAYSDKFGFLQTAVGGPNLPPAQINTISLCMEVIGTTTADAATPNCAPQLRGAGPQSCLSMIYAKVQPTGGIARYFCVNYKHNEHGITAYGTVRWHWRDDDDTIWVSCPFGCCEVLVDGDGRG